MSTSGITVKPVKDETLLSKWSCLGRSGGHTSRNNNCSLDSNSIEIYLSTADSLTPMKVLPSDTIQSVKLKIQRCKGFYVKHQMLIYGGRELARADCLIKDYGVRDGNVLYLVLRLSDLQVVRVKTFSGNKYVFRVGKRRNIQDLKQKISERECGLPLDDQQLVLKGENLEDKRLIEDLLLEDDAIIHLVVRKEVKVSTIAVGIGVEVKFVVPGVTDYFTTDADTKGDNKPLITTPLSHGLTNSSEESYDKFVDDYVAQPGYLLPVTTSLCSKLSPSFCDLIRNARGGLESGWSPVRSTEGCGGAYFLQDPTGSKFVGVFKPIDEEPMALNNPRGLPVSSNGEGLKKGTRVGEGAYREVAAYILDHPRGRRRSPWASDEPGFAGVPPTIIVKCCHSAFCNSLGQEMKIGSLQKFVECESSCEDMGPAAFPVHEVHKITVLDIRLANADRHSGNILVCNKGESSSIKLVPIDHGYCLPENFEDCTFEWLFWPQARQPYSLETLKYIESLDADKDIQLLQSHGWTLSPKCRRVFRISTMLLKKGAAAGLTPYKIASMMCRESLNKPSILENIIDEAEEAILLKCGEAAFLEAVSQGMGLQISKEKHTQ